jgi:hypothetical protein
LRRAWRILICLTIAGEDKAEEADTGFAEGDCFVSPGEQHSKVGNRHVCWLVVEPEVPRFYSRAWQQDISALIRCYVPSKNTSEYGMDT